MLLPVSISLVLDLVFISYSADRSVFLHCSFLAYRLHRNPARRDHYHMATSDVVHLHDLPFQPLHIPFLSPPFAHHDPPRRGGRRDVRQHQGPHIYRNQLKSVFCSCLVLGYTIVILLVAANTSTGGKRCSEKHSPETSRQLMNMMSVLSSIRIYGLYSKDRAIMAVLGLFILFRLIIETYVRPLASYPFLLTLCVSFFDFVPIGRDIFGSRGPNNRDTLYIFSVSASVCKFELLCSVSIYQLKLVPTPIS